MLMEVLTHHHVRWPDGRLVWWVDGEHGVVSFVASMDTAMTSLLTDDMQEFLGAVRMDGGVLVGWDVGVHHRCNPGDWAVRCRDCTLVPETGCWYEGSTLAAREVIKDWEAAGFNDEVIYAELERRYEEYFGGEQ